MLIASYQFVRFLRILFNFFEPWLSLGLDRLFSKRSDSLMAFFEPSAPKTGTAFAARWAKITFVVNDLWAASNHTRKWLEQYATCFLVVGGETVCV